MAEQTRVCDCIGCVYYRCVNQCTLPECYKDDRLKIKASVIAMQENELLELRNQLKEKSDV